MLERNPTPDMDRLAGVLDRRFEALLVDAIFLVVGLVAIGYVVGAVTGGGWPVAVVFAQFAMLPVLFLYFVVFEGHFGRTPGKALRGIVVVKKDGSPCTWGGAVVRNLLRYVDVLPFLYVVGIVVSYLNEDNQRLGDIGGGTVVVYAAE